MNNAKSSVLPSSTEINGKKEGLCEVSVFHDHYAAMNIVFFIRNNLIHTR